MVHICFTGGGTAGHVTPNLALIHAARDRDWQVSYIGGHAGIEKEIMRRENVAYYGIRAGKLHRRLDYRNLLTPLNVLAGMVGAWCHLRRLKPDVVFSKGGFVAFPVVFAAWCWRIPVIIHESDRSPGLANRMSFPFARKLCLTFATPHIESAHPEKVLVSGTPIRAPLLAGDKASGLVWCGFTADKPVICVIGGGLGAAALNACVQAALPALVQQYQVIHCCGKGKRNPTFDTTPGYKQVEYVDEPLADIFACADVIVSRAGANTLYELLYLKKPHILIPLPRAVSRGDQVENAAYFKAQGLSEVLAQSELTPMTLLARIADLFAHKQQVSERLAKANIPNGTDVLMATLTAMIPHENA